MCIRDRARAAPPETSHSKKTGTKGDFSWVTSNIKNPISPDEGWKRYNRRGSTLPSSAASGSVSSRM
eukprot:4787655-Alexandrium_andersonii.AAC.1